MTFVSACVHLPRVDEGRQAQLKRYLLTEFIRSGPEPSVRDMNIGEIRKKYGEPDTETVTNIQNIHDPKQTDQIHILSYYGIQIHVCHVNYKEPYDVVFAIDVSSNHHPMKFDIEIGDTKNKIIGLFGKPTESNSSITYSIEEPICCDEVSFYFDEKGDLESVHWKWALD